jgi:hypothetical protein
MAGVLKRMVDGGEAMKDIPAFPNEGFNGWGSPQEGMTLRDYFAAKAMQGWLANSQTSYDASYEKLAEIFYGMADAMMKAREA